MEHSYLEGGRKEKMKRQKIIGLQGLFTLNKSCGVHTKWDDITTNEPCMQGKVSNINILSSVMISCEIYRHHKLQQKWQCQCDAM